MPAPTADDHHELVVFVTVQRVLVQLHFFDDEGKRWITDPVACVQEFHFYDRETALGQNVLIVVGLVKERLQQA